MMLANIIMLIMMMTLIIKMMMLLSVKSFKRHLQKLSIDLLHFLPDCSLYEDNYVDDGDDYWR